MPKREFVENVWIVKRQVRDHKPGSHDVLDDLPSNHSGLSDLVCAYDFQTELFDSRLDQGAQEQVRVLTQLGALVPDRGNVEANFGPVQFSRCPCGVSRMFIRLCRRRYRNTSLLLQQMFD